MIGCRVLAECFRQPRANNSFIYSTVLVLLAHFHAKPHQAGLFLQFLAPLAHTVIMPIIDDYLIGVSRLLRSKDASELKLFLRVEPPLPANFAQLGQELKSNYQDNNVLERKITKLIPENEEVASEEGDVWPGFLAFMKEYLEYWRDVNFEDLLETHSQLSGLAK
jgi:hypothetical protein